MAETEQYPESQETTPTESSGEQTPIDSDIRKTGQGTQDSDTEDTNAEQPGGNPLVEGNPNQGTEAR